MNLSNTLQKANLSILHYEVFFLQKKIYKKKLFHKLNKTKANGCLYVSDALLNLTYIGTRPEWSCKKYQIFKHTFILHLCKNEIRDRVLSHIIFYSLSSPYTLL